MGIGVGSIVVAGSLVTKDTPPCKIWGGVPAKKIYDRFKNNEEKQRHMVMLNKLGGKYVIFKSRSTHSVICKKWRNVA